MCNLSTGIYEQGMEQGMVRGLEQGRQEEKINTVLKMLRGNLPLETIVQISEIPMEKIKVVVLTHGKGRTTTFIIEQEKTPIGHIQSGDNHNI